MNKLKNLAELKQYPAIDKYHYCRLNKKLYVQLVSGYSTDELAEFSALIVQYAISFCGVKNFNIQCKDWDRFIDMEAVKQYETTLNYN